MRKAVSDANCLVGPVAEDGRKVINLLNFDQVYIVYIIYPTLRRIDIQLGVSKNELFHYPTNWIWCQHVRTVHKF